MLVDVASDIRTDGRDRETSGASVVELACNQLRGETAALEVGEDLGVPEHDAPREEPILREAREGAVDEHFVALQLRVVGDPDCGVVILGHGSILVLFAGIRTIERERVDVNGKKAMVVGGASGMGRATAELLHERGASIAILDLESSAGSDVAKALGGSFHPCDVTDDEGVELAVTDAVATLGGLHIAVNTAGGESPSARSASRVLIRSTTSGASST